jgi:hypothetical protein
MSKLRLFAGLISVVALGVCLFAVAASAAQRTAAAKCSQRAGGHNYAVTHRVMSCAKAKGYVKTVAAERLNPKRPGELPKSPKGFKCSAYGNSKNVQTFGTCRANKGKSGFDWSMTK